jgi:hypothetical protein
VDAAAELVLAQRQRRDMVSHLESPLDRLIDQGVGIAPGARASLDR